MGILILIIAFILAINISGKSKGLKRFFLVIFLTIGLFLLLGAGATILGIV